jgi:O-methyltransferase involved in polyketide biosynthesis
MTRSDTDTWDLASSVGATATMVAAARALATEDTVPIINDPYAAPLVRAVGIDFFTRVVDGEIDPGDAGVDGTGELQTETDSLAVRTKFFDDFFTDAAAAGIGQSVILAAGLDSRAYRLDWPAGTRSSHLKRRRWPVWAPNRRRNAARSASTCATTGRPHSATAGSTTPNRRPGAPRAC